MNNIQLMVVDNARNDETKDNNEQYVKGVVASLPKFKYK
jgi:hypothetical protein